MFLSLTLLDFIISSIASFTTALIIGNLLTKESKLNALDITVLPYFHGSPFAMKIPLAYISVPNTFPFSKLRAFYSKMSLLNLSPRGTYKNVEREFVSRTFKLGFFSFIFPKNAHPLLYFYSLFSM